MRKIQATPCRLAFGGEADENDAASIHVGHRDISGEDYLDIGQPCDIGLAITTAWAGNEGRRTVAEVYIDQEESVRLIGRMVEESISPKADPEWVAYTVRGAVAGILDAVGDAGSADAITLEVIDLVTEWRRHMQAELHEEWPED